MYNWKRVEPRIEPWGILALIVDSWEDGPFRTMQGFLLLRNEKLRLKI